MPRWASKQDLRVLNVRVVQVQSISGNDARQLGAAALDDVPTVRSGVERVGQFACSWDEVYARHGFPFEGGPWAWLVEFKVL
jgi:hypothetical protein